MEMLENTLGPDLDKKAALEYMNEKFLKLNDLEIEKLMLKGNSNAFNVPAGEDTLGGGGFGSAPASSGAEGNPFASHAPAGEEVGGETPAPSTAPEESEVKEEPAEEEKNPFHENLSISDLRSMVPLKESREKWDAQWSKVKVKITEKK